jgi:FkbM family methyltransferase
MISTIKKLANYFGFEIRRFDPCISESAQFMRQLDSHGINLVLDVGANVGQFGRKNLRDAGYRGRIVSFEPLRAAWKGLSQEAAGDRLWTVAPRTAIGAEAGDININVSQNSVSSSILDMLPEHQDSAPESKYVAIEVVPIRRLDEIAPKYLLSDSIVFLKIDTQGFEGAVLQGAEGILNHVTGIQLELSLIPLYAGQQLYDEMIARLNQRGFDLWGVSTAFVDSESGRTLQVDATFFRRL